MFVRYRVPMFQLLMKGLGLGREMTISKLPYCLPEIFWSSPSISYYFFKNCIFSKQINLTFIYFKGYRYAATQFKTFCSCGQSYGRYGKSNNCNMSCSGNKNEICGGGWANSVYSTSDVGM